MLLRWEECLGEQPRRVEARQRATGRRVRARARVSQAPWPAGRGLTDCGTEPSGADRIAAGGSDDESSQQRCDFVEFVRQTSAGEALLSLPRGVMAGAGCMRTCSCRPRRTSARVRAGHARGKRWLGRRQCHGLMRNSKFMIMYRHNEYRA